MNTETDTIRNGSKAGFTLVEIVFAGMLSVILFFPLANLSNMVVLNSQYSRQSTEALVAGQRQLEAMDASGYASIATGTATDGKYTLSWTSTERAGTKRVRMTVSWVLSGQPYSINLNTVYNE